MPRVPFVSFPASFAMVALAGAGPAASASAQAATVPEWSTYFGGQDLDWGQAICRGPGNLITIAGTTLSAGLAHGAAVHQSTYAGNGDGYVARFDPSLPPGSQLLWCTYFGGSDLEIVFDVEVDAVGNVLFAGCTHSPGWTTNGPGDGFVARLDGSNGSLMNFVRVGGTHYDRITDLALLPSGAIAFVGVTEPSGPPGLPNALNAYWGGTSDGFVGVVDLATGTIPWTRHLGGPTFDGYTMVSYLANGGITAVWPGNLKRQAVTILPGGRIGLVTVANQSAVTLAGVHPGVYQSQVTGGSDIYYVELATTGQVEHATLIGGSLGEWAKDLAPHPTGGVVITGATFSADLPTTQTPLQATFAGNPFDGFLLHFDPSLPTGQVRYGTFVGGNGGEDLFTRLAVDASSGLVTLVGYSHSGGSLKFPTTAGSLLRNGLPGQPAGAIVRLRLGGNGRGDLVYGTLIGPGNTILFDVALDDRGEPIASGATGDPSFPVQHPQQGTFAGGFDATITHLPMLPGGTARQEVARAVPACAQPLHATALGEPVAGNPHYLLGATHAPPVGIGVLAFGVPMPPTPWLNVDVLVNPSVLLGAIADALGFASQPLPIPTNLPPGFQTWTQWAFLTTPACPGSGPVATTERLQITTL